LYESNEGINEIESVPFFQILQSKMQL